MTKYILYFSLSVVLSLLITPLIRILAQKLNIIDLPSERKIHQKPTPLLGGIPIFIAFNLSVLIGVLFNFEYHEKLFTLNWKPIFISQVIILGIGIYDDVKRVKPGLKLLFQIVSGSLLVVFGFQIHNITNPFTGNLISLGIFSIPITILWVVTITNALNLVDGLDGLAAGTSIIACATVFGISFIFQNIGIALASLILAGSVLGFLKYNFYPAKIFLGDSGSLLLGFLLAVLSIEGISKGATLVAVLAPILILGFPIMETLLSMTRRFLRPVHLDDNPHKNGKLRHLFLKGSSMFNPDRDHIHHRLLKLGFSQRNAVIILYGICAIFCALSFLIIAWENINITLFLGAITVAIFIGIKSLNYREFKVFKKGLTLPLFDTNFIIRRLFTALIDLLCISLAYYASFILTFHPYNFQAKTLFIKTLPFVLVLKIIIFYLSGLYKCSLRHTRLEDLIRIVKALIFSSIGSSLLLVLLYGLKSYRSIVFFVADFFVLISLVAGLRISYRVLNYYYHKKDFKKGRKVVIYGAGTKGSLLAKELQFNKNFHCHVVGFIDDAVHKKGNSSHNIPVLGTYTELEEIIHKNKVNEIIISTEKIGKEKINSLEKLCSENGITIQPFELKNKKLI